jgi:membrane-bound lytic murein transglycosylase MltF
MSRKDDLFRGVLPVQAPVVRHALLAATPRQVMLIALVGGAIGIGAQTRPPAPPDSSPSAMVASKPWTGDFDGMVARRRIRILTPYSRTHYFVDKGQPRGLIHDIAVELEEEINRQLKTTRQTRVFVVVRPTSRDDLYASLVEGRGDIVAAGLTVTPERAKLVDFTDSARSDIKEIVVTGPGAPKLTTVDDLAGQWVYVRERSIQSESLAAVNAALKARGKPAIEVKTVPRSLEDEDILEMVSAGMIKATVVDDYMATFWAQVLPNLTVHQNIVVRDGVQLAWAVRKNSPKLLAVLNPFTLSHRRGTLFGNVLFQKYLKSTQIVKSSTSPAELTKFEALQQIFKKYGQQYELDYLLMMAQGYQESRLDQSVRSQVGAIGVMQVMPATGERVEGRRYQPDRDQHSCRRQIYPVHDRPILCD